MQRRIVSRRMGILMLAIAVPAMAAPSGPAQRENVQVSFALADVPQYRDLTAAAPELADTHDGQAPLAEAELLAPPMSAMLAPHLLSDLDSGPAARSFAISGSLTDRARATRCMTMAIYYEAASESTDGQRAVAQVVMNRVSHPSYPNSVCGVVFQGSERATGCQFSFTCDGSLNRQPQQSAWLRAERAARAALGGFVYQPIGLATHYHTTAVSPYWAGSLQEVGQVGAHLFYRWRGAAGRPAAFQAAYRGGEFMPSWSPSRVFANATYATSPVLDASSVPAPPDHSATPAANIAAAPVQAARAPADENLPRPGTVLREHQQSGQWLTQP